MADQLITDALLQSMINNKLYRNRFPFLGQLTKSVSSQPNAKCSKCKRRTVNRSVPDFARIRQTIAAMPNPDKKDLKVLMGATGSTVRLKYNSPDGKVLELQF